MISRKLIYLGLSLIICTTLFAQTDPDLKYRYQIKGKIVEMPKKESVPYSTIQAFNDRNQIITAAASDTAGVFTINLKSSGKYSLKFYAMGYAPDSLSVFVEDKETDIGVVSLRAEDRQLSAITVSAKRIIMKDEFDRLVYDVTKDPEAKRVKMADIMKKIPFMTFNGNDGKLKYINDNIAKILIDGKPNEMISVGRQFPMRLIKGDVMSKIEIILPGTPDNPGNKPIINIKLARELPNGYAAEAKADGNTQNAINGNVDFITKLNNKMYISLAYGVNYQNSPRLESYTAKESLQEDAVVHRQENESISWGNNLSHNVGIGTTYNITKKDNIRLSLTTKRLKSNNYFRTSSESYNISDSLLSYKNNNSKNSSEDLPKINMAFDFSHRWKNNAVLIVEYNMSNSNNNSDYKLLTDKSDGTKPNRQTSSSDNSIKDQSVSIDLIKKKGTKLFLEAQARYTNREYTNSSIFEYWNYNTQNLETYSLQQNGLSYNQQIYSIFGRYSYMNNRLSVNFILEGEQMVNRGVFRSSVNSKLDYNEMNLFPSLSIVYRTKHKYKVGFQYKTRILRPNINYLNPFVDNSDPDNIFVGNPNLKAEYANSFKSTITKSFGNYIGLSVDFATEFTNNAVERTTKIDKQGISTTSYGNIGIKRDYYSNATFYFSALRKLFIMNMFSIRRTDYENKETNMRNSVCGLRNYLSMEYSVFKSTDVSGQLDISPQMESAQTKKVNYYKSIRFSVTQTLVKEKLFLTLSIKDPFKSHKFIFNSIGSDSFIMDTRQEKQGRVLGFSLRWNFGRMKEKAEFSTVEPAPDLVRPDLTTK